MSRDRSYPQIALDALCRAVTEMVATETVPSVVTCLYIEQALRHLSESISREARDQGYAAADQLRDALHARSRGETS